MKGKKGLEFTEAPQLLILFFVIVVLLSVSGTLFFNMQETTRDTVAATSTAVTLNNNTAVALTHKDLVSGSTACVNASAGNTMGTGNYSIDTGPGTITLAEPTAAWHGEDVNCTYNRYDHNEKYNITGYGLEGGLNISALLPTIGIMIGIIIVIFLLFIIWNPKDGMGV